MMALKVLFLDYNGIDVMGGPPLQTRGIVSKLLELGHTPIVMSGPTNNRGLSNSKFLISKGVQVEIIKFIKHTSIPTLKSALIIIKLLKEVDMVYFTFCPGGLELFMLIAMKLVGSNVVVVHHQPLEYTEYLGELNLSRRMWYLIFGFRSGKIAKFFRYHHVESKGQSDFLSISGLTVVKIPPFPIIDENAINVGFTRARDPCGFKVLFMGRLVEQKGADHLPELFKLITEKISDFEFIVIGSGSMMSNIEREVNDGRFRLIGFVDERTKLEILSSSDVLVVLSRWEGFYVPGLEALTYGLPVISFDVSGPDEYISNGKNGWVVDNLKEMTEKIDDLHSMSPKERETISAFCRKSVKEFTVEETTFALLSFFGKIMGHQKEGVRFSR